MANAILVQEGNAINYTPTTDVEAGDVVTQEELVGVAHAPIRANSLGALAVSGVFDVKKDDTAIAVGVKVFWDNAAKVATTTATSNTLMGLSILAAKATDETVRVRLA